MLLRENILYQCLKLYKNIKFDILTLKNIKILHFDSVSYLPLIRE